MLVRSPGVTVTFWMAYTKRKLWTPLTLLLYPYVMFTVSRTALVLMLNGIMSVLPFGALPFAVLVL